MSNYYLCLLVSSKPLLNYHRPSLLLGFFIATLSTPVCAWQPINTGMNSYITILATDKTGNLYAGGDFTIAGGINANHIARWESGSTWSALGSGVNNGQVYALTFDSNNNLYVGGSFSSAGGTPINNIARWSSNTWSAVGTSADWSHVEDLHTSANGTVFIEGIHTYIDNGGVHNIRKAAQLSGNSWLDLGVGNNGINNLNYTLTTDSLGNVYIGGLFTAIDDIGANRVAKWNGASWSALGLGVTDGVYDLITDSANNLYAAGTFTSAGGVSATGVAKWDGNTWSALGSGINNPAAQALIKDTDGNIYAGGGGNNFFARWNGSTWTNLGGLGHYVTTMAIDPSNNIYVGGNGISNISVYVSQALIANQWRMVSLPHVPLGGATLQSNNLFGDNLNPATYESTWVVYERNEATKTYRKLALTDTLSQGKGYWVYSTTPVTLDMNGTATPVVPQTTNPNCISSKGCYEVTLTSPVSGETKRQSLIGFPFFRPTSWADVRFEVNGFAYSPSAAETNNFAAKTLWKYNGSTYETYDDVTPGLTGKLAKMEGFWVRLLPGSTGKNVKLLIPLS